MSPQFAQFTELYHTRQRLIRALTTAFPVIAVSPQTTQVDLTIYSWTIPFVRIKGLPEEFLYCNIDAVSLRVTYTSNSLPRSARYPQGVLERRAFTTLRDKSPIKMIDWVLQQRNALHEHLEAARRD